MWVFPQYVDSRVTHLLSFQTNDETSTSLIVVINSSEKVEVFSCIKTLYAFLQGTPLALTLDGKYVSDVHVGFVVLLTGVLLQTRVFCAPAYLPPHLSMPVVGRYIAAFISCIGEVEVHGVS